MANLLDEFVNFTTELSQSGIEYAVCGGWAMAIHGLPRATIDIDLLILSDDLEKAWLIAQSQGYDVEGLPLHFADGAIEIRRISKVDKDTKRLFTLDFLLVTEQLEEVWTTRELVKWDDGTAWVVSKDGLIRLKTISGREQDLLDIKKLHEVDNEG
jgi:Domain of unknown function (DUF1814).